MVVLKNTVKHLLGENLLGIIDYYRYPERRISWGGPFNGQLHRQKIFQDILLHCQPAMIVETGTYKGTTTRYMATESGLPVYTVEFDGRNYGFARHVLRKTTNVRLYKSDSRSFLRLLLDSEILRGDPILFYLDAHWSEDLPLSEEVEMVFAKKPQSIVMVDDFQVPGDAGYEFDDYGEGKSLDKRYIEELIEKFELYTFYPSIPSTEETGARRGCVVLAGKDYSGKLKKIRSLSQHV